MNRVISPEELLPDLENRLIGAFIHTDPENKYRHRCKAKVIRGSLVDLNKRGDSSNYYSLGFTIHESDISRMITCEECGYWEGVHILKNRYKPFFEKGEIEKLTQYINQYHPLDVISKLGLEDDTPNLVKQSIETSAPEYHVHILGLHVGGWRKTLGIGADIDFTDYDKF